MGWGWGWGWGCRDIGAAWTSAGLFAQVVSLGLTLPPLRLIPFSQSSLLQACPKALGRALPQSPGGGVKAAPTSSLPWELRCGALGPSGPAPRGSLAPPRARPSRWPRPASLAGPAPRTSPPARLARAAPTRLAGDRKVFLRAPAAAAVPVSSGRTCGHADASPRGPGARSGRSSSHPDPGPAPAPGSAGGRASAARPGPGGCRGGRAGERSRPAEGPSPLPRRHPPQPRPLPAPPPSPGLFRSRPGAVGVGGKLRCPASPDAGRRRGCARSRGALGGSSLGTPGPAGPRSWGERVSWDPGQALYDVILSPA